MGKKKMTKDEMRYAARAEYEKAIAPSWRKLNKAREAYDKVRDAVWAKFQKRLDEINKIPDDEVDPEVQKAIEFLKSKGITEI